jgi:hypothetical protein
MADGGSQQTGRLGRGERAFAMAFCAGSPGYGV